MTTPPSQALKWKNIGFSRTSPVSDTARKSIELDVFYLVIGFEVNNTNAFKNNTHDLAMDYGHAFYYLVQNVKIIQSFSFGPNDVGKTGWFDKAHDGGNPIYRVGAIKEDGHKNSRPGTADYMITEKVKAFKLPLNRMQANTLNQKTTKARIEIYRGDLTYSAIVNDTCAETAKEILDDSNIETPNGSSWVKNSKVADIPIAHAVNPYRWHKDFKTKYEEVVYHRTENPRWIPLIGRLDPIYGTLLLKKS